MLTWRLPATASNITSSSPSGASIPPSQNRPGPPALFLLPPCINTLDCCTSRSSKTPPGPLHPLLIDNHRRCLLSTSAHTLSIPVAASCQSFRAANSGLSRISPPICALALDLTPVGFNCQRGRAELVRNPRLLSSPCPRCLDTETFATSPTYPTTTITTKHGLPQSARRRLIRLSPASSMTNTTPQGMSLTRSGPTAVHKQ